MSSYLTIYIRPDKDVEPIPLVHFTRSTEIYQAFEESVRPVYIGIGDETRYTELTEALVDSAIQYLYTDLRNAEARVLEYEKHADGHIDIIEEILHQHEYIDDLKYAIHQAEFILDLVRTTEYPYVGVKRTILCNID
jgi:hypothetical protein